MRTVEPQLAVVNAVAAHLVAHVLDPDIGHGPHALQHGCRLSDDKYVDCIVPTEDARLQNTAR